MEAGTSTRKGTRQKLEANLYHPVLCPSLVKPLPPVFLKAARSQPCVLAPAPNFPMYGMNCLLWMSCDCSTAQLFGRKTFPLHSVSLIYPPMPGTQACPHPAASGVPVAFAPSPQGVIRVIYTSDCRGRQKLCLLSWMTLLTFCHRIY